MPEMLDEQGSFDLPAGVTLTDSGGTFSTGPKKIASEDEYNALPGGTDFIDPEGNTRTKPHMPKSKEEFDAVPEGADFIDPEGNTRTKPKYEGIDYTAQTLYDMALTPKEKRRALERSYPGKVQGEDDDLYVEDNGVFRKPGRGISGAGGFLTSAAAPTLMSIFGAIGGGQVGGMVTGPLAPVGGMAGTMLGGAGGGYLGQWMNDLVLTLAGVSDPEAEGQKEVRRWTGAGTGMMGAGVGRGIANVVPSLTAKVSAAGAALPSLAAHFLGAGKEELKQARELAEQGVKVPVSTWAHESPHLQNINEVFDPAFRTNRPLVESAQQYYEKSAGQILNDIGITDVEKILAPSAKVSSREVGEALQARALQELGEADRMLQATLQEQKAGLAIQAGERPAASEAIQSAAATARDAAQRAVQQGFDSIQREIDAAVRISERGGNGSDLWTAVGHQLQELRRGVSQRAETMYRQADQLAGGATINAEGLGQTAERFIQQLPEGFEARYPDLVRRIRAFTQQEVRNAAGEVEDVIPAVQPTLGQLHELRTYLRSNLNYYDMTPDVREGVYKYFAKQVDDTIQAAARDPRFEPAVRQLNETDRWYREAIQPFNDKTIQAVVKGLEAGMPADPQALANLLLKENKSALVNRVREMIGPNLWSGVRAADLQEMMDLSRGLVPDQIDGRAFVRQVLDRHRNNMLEPIHGRQVSQQLLQQAEYVERLAGRIDVPVRPGDTVASVIGRARTLAKEAELAAKQDPLATLQRETRALENEYRRARSDLNRARRDDPLGFLSDMKVGAADAADRIMKSEDLILAAAARFGEKSPEFDALRKVYLQRILESGMRPSKELEKISPEIQQIMFPGTTKNQLHTLAKNMDFLMDTRSMGGQTAGSMSAMAKVENPTTNIPGLRGVAKAIPGLNPMARAARTKYYAFVTDLMTSPATLRWIEKGLNGTPEQRAAVKMYTERVLLKGGAVGAGGAQAVSQELQQ